MKSQVFKPAVLCNSCGAFVVPVFMLAATVAAFWFAVVFDDFAIICYVFVFSAFSALVFVFALSCTMSIFAAVVALSDLQLWDVSLGRVKAVVDIDSSFYTAVCSEWVVGEYNDRVMLSGSFAVFSAKGCSFDYG